MTLTIATFMAGGVAVFSPLALKYIKLDGLQMMALTLVVSVVITAGAGLLVGDLHFDRASLLVILTGGAGFWTVQQVVYRTLKERAPTLVAEAPKAA